MATFVHLIIAQKLLHSGHSPYFGNVLAFVAAFGVSYVGHFYLTFEGLASHRLAFWRFATIAFGGFLLNNLTLMTLLGLPNLSASLALAIAILVVPISVYLASRFWAFSQHHLSQSTHSE